MPQMKILLLAPHLDIRLMDGAGFRSLSILNLLAKDNSILSIQRSSINLISASRNVSLFKWKRFYLKRFSAILALTFRSHYIQSKHIGLLYRLCLFLGNVSFSPDIVYIHFLWTFPFVRFFCSKRVVVVDTHNYDPDWWENLESTSRWSWEKRLCRISKQRILEILADLPKNTLLVHVSQEDADKYRTHRPDLTHLVLPNGCTMRPRASAPFYSAPIKKIYFLGALNLQITRDAILHFDKTLWPQFSSYCEFHLIGSGPAGFWKPFCAERGWHLHNNVPDDDLTQLLEGMHYLVLPFTYGAGSKLKFIDACARGIPVISTPPGVCGFSNLPPTVRISENPKDWVKWISSSQGPTEAEVTSCLTFAKEFSWDNLVAKVWPQIQNHPPVP